MSLTGHTVVYGGSFNPPHLGHQMACLYLLEGLGAAAVWVLPAFVHPFGKPLASFTHRLAMCRLTAKALGARVTVSDIESRRDASGYTYDTLCALRALYPRRQWALAIGSDILAETHAWHRWSEIEELATVVVIGRQGAFPPTRDGIAMPAIASRDIRARLARHEPIEGLVPERVRDYIAEHGLYLDASVA